MDILDASALIRQLKKESGYKEIDSLFQKAEKEKLSIFMCQVNFLEVVYFLMKRYGKEHTDKVLVSLKSPFLAVSDYMDTDLSLYAATLKSTYNLSLGDAIGLAFTKIMKGTFWTADKQLKNIAKKESISIRLLG